MPGYVQQKMEGADLTQDEREALAKQYYAEAGYGPDNPLKVDLLYNTSDNHRKIAIAVASMWNRVLGVKAGLTNQEWKVYLDTRGQRQYEVVRAAWIGDYLDPSNFMEQFMESSGAANDLGYNNATHDDLLRQAQVTADVATRMKELQDAEAAFLADQPMIPIYHYTNQHLISTKVKGYNDNLLGYNLSRYMSIE